MDVAILCGGRGSRLRGYGHMSPKPMVTIGDQPLLWHVMQIYAAAGHNSFVLCLGYKAEVIRRFFTGHSMARESGRPGEDDVLTAHTNDGWTVRLVDTGADTMTGGRLGRIAAYVNGDTFFATYADGLSDVDIQALASFHAAAGRLATVTVVKPPPRYGVIRLDGDRVAAFAEKKLSEEPWVNGGFFVFDRQIFRLLDRDDIVLEQEPLAGLAARSQLSAFVHRGFWQCMDTPDDAARLDALWAEGKRPWIRQAKATFGGGWR